MAGDADTTAPFLRHSELAYSQIYPSPWVRLKIAEYNHLLSVNEFDMGHIFLIFVLHQIYHPGEVAFYNAWTRNLSHEIRTAYSDQECSAKTSTIC